MSMDLQDKNTKEKGPFVHSFGYAFCGIITAAKTERNVRIHLIIAAFVIILGFVLSLTVMEWLLIIIAIGGTISAELMNSAIEKVVDLSTEDFHPLAKQAKDMAAGAVLVFAGVSFLIGILIFGKRLMILLF